MRPLFPLILLVFFLPSCSLLQQAKKVNQRYYAEGEVKKIAQALQEQEPTYRVPATLYLTDDYGKYNPELKELLSITPVSEPLGAHIALLMGDGEALLARTSDTILLVNAHLLMGNVFEAERLMKLSAKKDIATEAIIHIRQERVGEGADLLKELLEQGEDREVKLRAARLLSLLGKGGWEYLSQQSPSEWERFMASTRLGSRTATTPREEAYVKLVSVLEQPHSLGTKEVARLLLSEPLASWRHHALREILPLVIEYKHWVELYSIAQEIPEMATLYPIHYQILQFRREVELMARFEAPEVTTVASAPSSSREGSFRSLWGNVTNIDNWVMQRSSLLSTPALTTRPTPEEYQLAHQLITRSLL